MAKLFVCLIGACAIASSAVAADSVVLGHGVRNAFLSIQPCPQDSLCLDSNYLWTFDADRTVVGPPVAGRVLAVASQHMDANESFVKAVELFVLRPLKDPKLRGSSGAKYYLVSLSARDASGRYCLSVNPRDVGLKLESSEVAIDATTGYFCFRASLLRRNDR
jgi:hypothetical protein